MTVNKKAPAAPSPNEPTVAAAPAIAEMPVKTELPPEPAEMARKSVDQAQAAFDKANDLAHSHVQIFDAAAGAFKANATEMQLKAMEIVQANSNAVFALTRRLLAATAPAELVEIQQSFVSEQLQAFLRQTGELNTMALKLASETAKPVQQGMLKSFDELKRAVAV